MAEGFKENISFFSFHHIWLYNIFTLYDPLTKIKITACLAEVDDKLENSSTTSSLGSQVVILKHLA